MPLGALFGALATISAVYFMGRREGALDSNTLLLGGVISASFLQAIIMFLMTTIAGRDVRGIAYWMMGTFRLRFSRVSAGFCRSGLSLESGRSTQPQRT